MQRNYFILALCSLLLLAPAVKAAWLAHARVFGTMHRSTAVGTVVFSQDNENSEVVITYSLAGLPADSTLGFHVHQYGDLTSTDGTAAGGHYNPGNAPHGCYPDANRHAGDIGNITTDTNGAASGTMNRDLLQLSGNWSIIGRAIVIHASADDCTGTTGNAGNRLAVGVIGIGSGADAGTENIYNTSVLVATLAPIADSGVTGMIFFRADGTNGSLVQVYARIYGLAANSVHGFHVHAWGDLSFMNNGTSAGGHFNPYGKTHNYPGTTERHVGDMGNITAAWNGQVYFNNVFDLLALGGANNIIGRAVLVHADPDEGSVDPVAGSAGSRVAMGVIGVTNTAFPTIETAPASAASQTANSMIAFAVALLSIAFFRNH